MNDHNNDVNNKSLAEVISTIKEEFKQFASTRIQLFQVETRQKLALLKVAGVLAAAAVVLLTTAYLFFTLALAALVATLIAPNPYNWVFGFLTIAVLWGVPGALAAYLAKREFELKGILPTRTIQVLKGDKIWLQTEAKEQL
jgi:uncharacterized membrane protein YqjE